MAGSVPFFSSLRHLLVPAPQPQPESRPTWRLAFRLAAALMLILNLPGFSPAATQPESGRGARPLLIFYSNDVRAELEPCG